MPLKTQTFRVLIASPSDLQEERDDSAQAIAEWNDLHAAQHRKLRSFKAATQKHALTATFTSPENLQKRLRTDLTREVRKWKSQHPIRSDRLDRVLKTTELLRLHKQEKITPEEFAKFEQDILGKPLRRTKAETADPIAAGEVGFHEGKYAKGMRCGGPCT